MKDRDVHAQPGGLYDDDLEGDELEATGRKRVDMPRRANLLHSDQARRLRDSAQARKTGARPAAEERPTGGERHVDSERHVEGARRTPQFRISDGHPLRARRERSAAERRRHAGPSIGPAIRGFFSALGGGVVALGRGVGRARPSGLGRALRPSNLRRAIFRRPSLRELLALAAVATTAAIVTGLVVTLPAAPAGPPSATGSIYGVTWDGTVKGPAGRIDYGPYFTTYGNDMLMVGTTGNDTTVWASGDGVNWTTRSGTDAFKSGGRRFVAQGVSDDGAGGLVVIGNSIGTTPTDVAAAAWHSRDGSSWTSMPVDNASGQEMIGGVAARPGMAVAAGNGVAWVSTDARTWSYSILPDASNYTLKAVGSWSGGFAIIGLWNGTGTARPEGSAVWYSATGLGWVKSPTALDGFDARGIAGANGHIVAVGTDTSVNSPGLAGSWASADGLKWVKATAPTDDTTVAMDGVTAVNGTFLAYGAPLVINPPAVASAGPTLKGSTPAPAAAESVWVSEDGSSWLPMTSTAPPLGRGRVVALGSLIVMVGHATGSVAVVPGEVTMGIARAPEQSLPPANFALSLQAGDVPMIVGATKDDQLADVVTTKDRFFAILTGPVGSSVWSSPNGTLWAEEIDSDGLTAQGTSGRPVIFQAVSDGQGGVLAAGKVTNDQGDNGTIWHMTKDGKWTQATMQDDAPPEFASIAAGPNGWVASSDVAGGSHIMYSSDGDNWSAGSIQVADGFALTVAAYRYGFVAVGSDPARAGVSTAWTSPDGRTWTMRSDWHLPPNVTSLFGQGNGLVLSAVAATPVPAATPTPAPASSGKPKTTPKPTPKPKPTPVPTPAPVQNKVSWFWSTTGASWQSTGLTTADGAAAVVNGEIVVFDVPVKTTDNWVVWTSSDGKIWLHPTGSQFLFKGQRTCGIGVIGNRVVIIGVEGPGLFKDFYGTFNQT